MVETDGDRVKVLITQEKWEKSKTLLQNIWSCLHPEGPNLLPFKKLESARGYLVYTTRTYPSMVPYLKGIHLTLDSWRSRRNSDGWRSNQIPTTDHDTPINWIIDPDETFDNINLERWEWDQDLGIQTYTSEMIFERTSPPTYVKAVPRLRNDIQALLTLTQTRAPLRRIIQSKQCLIVNYGFGDASGVGFGAAFVGSKPRPIG